MSRQSEDEYAKTLDALARMHTDGSMGDAEYELKRSRLAAEAAKIKGGTAARVFTVIGIIAVALIVVRIGGYAYAKANEPARWADESNRSCSLMLALRGGVGTTLTVTKTGQLGDLPNFTVTGGALAGEPVYCLNHVEGTDRKVGASSVFLLDGTKA